MTFSKWDPQNISSTDFNPQVEFPDEIPVQKPPRLDYNFKDLDFETQQQLLDLCDQVNVHLWVNPGHI